MTPDFAALPVKEVMRQLRMPPELDTRLRALAAVERRSIQNMLLVLVIEAMDAREHAAAVARALNNETMKEPTE